MKDKTADAALRDPTSMAQETATDGEGVTLPELPGLRELAVLLDIDGTLIELAPTPRAIVVPEGLVATLNGLLQNTSGALALVSGGRARAGQTLHVPMPDGPIAVQVTSPVFYDPTGARINA